MKISTKLIIFLMTLVFIFTSCRKEGDDGLIYLSVIDYFDTLTYTDDNTDVPDNPDSDYYYGPCREGNYNFIYTHTALVNGVPTTKTVTGSYYIFADKGEKGGLFIKGEPGEDRWFELHLSNGGYIVRTGYPYQPDPLNESAETQHFERTHKFGKYAVQVKGKIETTKTESHLINVGR